MYVKKIEIERVSKKLFVCPSYPVMGILCNAVLKWIWFLNSRGGYSGYFGIIFVLQVLLVQEIPFVKKPLPRNFGTLQGFNKIHNSVKIKNTKKVLSYLFFCHIRNEVVPEARVAAPFHILNLLWLKWFGLLDDWMWTLFLFNPSGVHLTLIWHLTKGHQQFWINERVLPALHFPKLADVTFFKIAINLQDLTNKVTAASHLRFSFYKAPGIRLQCRIIVNKHVTNVYTTMKQYS